MIEAKRAVVAYTMRQSGTRFFSVLFVKADGSYREIKQGQLRVQKHLRGGKSTTAEIPYLVTVYDHGAKGYRKVNLDTVLSVTVDGNQIHFYNEKENV